MAPVSQGKGHVPEEKLHEYRKLASMARQCKTLGNQHSNKGDISRAEKLWEWSLELWEEANALRVDLPTE